MLMYPFVHTVACVVAGPLDQICDVTAVSRCLTGVMIIICVSVDYAQRRIEKPVTMRWTAVV